jgi:multiple sugar transport system substrate-binding protein
MTPIYQRSPSPSAVGIPLIGRRALLKGLGAAGLAAAIPSLAGCSPAPQTGGGGDTANKVVTFGSNYSDEVPRKALADVLKNFETSSGLQVKVNTIDHNTFQENLNAYLQGTPDDVWTWFAGYRMQFFAERKLAYPVSDVWQTIGPNFSEALKAASTGSDGQQYFVPFYYYHWAVFYRKSVFEERGYQPAKTWDEFKALLEQVKKDKLVPIAFADRDGWPAMGTFDYLNMRINGYDFHINLMAGKESWEDPKIKQVFEHWREILPYHQEGALGRTWQEAGQSLAQKKSAMYVLGMFVGQQFEDADREDLDFFPFPEINSEFGQDSVEAPIDGFMLSKAPKNLDGSKKLLEYLGSAEAQQAYLGSDPNNIATNNKADTSKYSEIQKKAAELVAGASHISQFLDRDTRPDFASTVMIPSLQDFLKNPTEIDGLLKKIEDQKKSIFAG